MSTKIGTTIVLFLVFVSTFEHPYPNQSDKRNHYKQNHKASYSSSSFRPLSTQATTSAKITMTGMIKKLKENTIIDTSVQKSFLNQIVA